MEYYKIRPHHGICFAFYIGKGYSEEFVENMNELQETLKDRDVRIQITKDLDAVCKKCPNSNGKACATQEKVEWLDSRVIKACGFQADQIRSYKEFADTVWEKLIKSGEWKRICNCCSWFSFCAEVENQQVENHKKDKREKQKVDKKM